jgi:hypothetical protein
VVSSVTVEGIVAVENGVEREYGMSFGCCYWDFDGEVHGTHLICTDLSGANLEGADNNRGAIRTS